MILVSMMLTVAHVEVGLNYCSQNGVSDNYEPYFASPYHKNDSILGSALGSLIFGDSQNRELNYCAQNGETNYCSPNREIYHGIRAIL